MIDIWQWSARSQTMTGQVGFKFLIRTLKVKTRGIGEHVVVQIFQMWIFPSHTLKNKKHMKIPGILQMISKTLTYRVIS